MNILITGASGFVGTNLINHFDKLGYQIDALDLGKPLAPDVRNYFRWEGLDDINFNLYDVVIHLAGIAHDTRGGVDEKKYMDVNYELTRELFVKFLDSDSASFIFFSSVKAVADRVIGEVLKEDVVAAPVGPYGKSKLAAENYILGAEKMVDKQLRLKRTYILRPCMIHGPGNKGNLNLLYNVISKGLPWPLASFDNKRSFTSIENLSYLIDQIINSNIPSGVYNIADDEPISTNRLIELISGVKGKRSKKFNISPRVIKRIAKIGDTLHLPLNSLRLQKLTENYIVSNDKIKRALSIDKLL